MSTNDRVLEALGRVQRAVHDNATGDASAHAKLLNEIHLLRAAVETPDEKATRIRFHTIQNLCIRVAMEYNILQIIAAKNGEPITAEELAKETGVDQVLIVRVMRLVTYVNYCDEVGPGTYAANETTAVVTQKAFIGAQKTTTELFFGTGAKLIELIRRHGLYQFPENPGEITPFRYAFGMDLIDYLKQDVEQKEAFNDYMVIRRPANQPQWFEIYPVEQELPLHSLKQDERAVLLVDVGSGKGHETVNFKNRFPSLPGRLVIQDLAMTFRNNEVSLEGVEVMDHDFFDKQPINAARLYYFRSVLHGWSDRKCEQILARTVAAMDKEYSRILIDDFVLPDVGADGVVASMDVIMMLLASGIERAESQWRRLLRSANLEIVNIWRAGAGYEAVIEAKVASN